MIRRLLWAGLCLALLLGPRAALHQACAKPHDLPLNQDNKVKPQVESEEATDDSTSAEDDSTSAESETPEQVPELAVDANGCPVVPTPKLSSMGPWSTPLSRAMRVFYQLPLGVRRNLAASILFTFHPLLVLTPTESFLDTPGDHPAPIVTDIEDLWRYLPSDTSSEDTNSFDETEDNVFHFGFGPDPHYSPEPRYPRNARRRILKNRWLRAVQQYRLLKVTEPLPAPPTPLALVDSSEVPKTTPCPNAGCTPAVPPEAVCPWHPQPIVDRYAEQFDDPDVTRDVLTNVDCLARARKLLEQGEMLCRTGHLCEALDCFEMVEELCPGRFDDRIQAIMTDLCVRLHGAEPGKDEVAAVPASEEQADSAASRGGFWQTFLGYFHCPFCCPERKPETVEPESEASECPKCEEMHRRFVLHCAKKKQSSPLVFVTYPVSDLLAEVPGDEGHKDDPAEERLIHFLTSDIKPASWYEMGGKGTIDYYPLTQSLVVGQTAENQAKVADALARIRQRAQDKLAVRTQVTGLLKACRLALADGRPGRASDLLRQAYALDPERVSADPLVYKMHLLLDDEGKTGSGDVEESSTPEYSCPFLQSITGTKNDLSLDAKRARFLAVCKQIGDVLDLLFPAHGGVEIGLGFPPGQLSLGYSLPLGSFVFHIRYHDGSVNVWMTSNTMAKDQ